MREYPVRICEGLGVKLPGPTRHKQASQRIHGHGASASVSGQSIDPNAVVDIDTEDDGNWPGITMADLYRMCDAPVRDKHLRG